MCSAETDDADDMYERTSGTTWDFLAPNGELGRAENSGSGSERVAISNGEGKAYSRSEEARRESVERDFGD